MVYYSTMSEHLQQTLENTMWGYRDIVLVDTWATGLSTVYQTLKFPNTAQNSAQYKTKVLFIPGTFHLMCLDQD